jgi:epoxide hydrolase-like predicted phosphatase
MSIQAIIFDFGGVLVRTLDQAGRIKWEKRLGLSRGELSALVFDSEASALASIGRAPESAVWQHVAATLKLNDEQLVGLQRDFWSGDWLDPELVQFLRDLRPQHKTAILSNAWGGARQAFTADYDLGNVVDAMVISAEEGVRKPDARIYQIAAARLGVDPTEAVFVDDVLENVQGAQAVGMRGVQFKNTTQTIQDVKRYLDGKIQLD